MNDDEKSAEFAAWVYKYCIDHRVNEINYSQEHLREIISKANELYGIKVDPFSFACGFSTACEILSDRSVAPEIVQEAAHMGPDLTTIRCIYGLL